LKLKAGDFDILESGTVIGYKSEPIVFELDDVGQTLTIRFKFERDEEKKEARIEPKILSPSSLDMFFYNFDDHPLGIGNSEAFKLGTFRGRALYLNYRLYTLAKAAEKLIHYTWYLGEVVGQ